ncbi:hypothetical protein V8E36_004038, partial [Tilletia maclaganii]
DVPYTALDRGQLGYNNQPHTVTDYRPSLRLQQCGHCQQFGHVARHCRRAPVCRLCAGKHPTSNHPPCQACKDSPSSACGQHSLKCANCAEAHMANDEQCAHRRAWRDALADNDAQAYQRNLPSNVTVHQTPRPPRINLQQLLQYS